MKVYIATPAYGDVSVHYAHGLALSCAALARSGIAFEYGALPGCCYVTRARDVLYAGFLASDCTHLLWIDSDIGFGPEDVAAVLQAPHDVVGIAYPKKVTPLEWAVNPMIDEDGCAEEMAGCVEVAGAPTGFLRISRHAAESVEREWSEQCAPYNVRGIAPDVAKRVRAYHSTEIVGGEWITEDFVWCRRWADIGGRIWIHAGRTVAHYGTHRYAGTPEDMFGGIKET